MTAPVRIFPTPKQMQLREGAYPALPPGSSAPLLPEEWIARVPALQVAVGARLALPDDVRPEVRAEAYQLIVDERGVRVLAETEEGVLRACATLRQLLRLDGSLPYGTLTDWPDFRHRCAADWLLNCEINRWAYDWGDGPEAYLARIQRKLDFCFAHKINQVWFDGFGWALQRFPGYGDLMRACNRSARQRGIKLTFAGYGGGYGTSYQRSELYRCGYQGRVFHNRRPWPDGPEYDCIGCEVPESRRLGTCASNLDLQAAKITDLREFVAAVEPGFLYLHDIDTGGFEASRQAWLWRCDECRRRWPSDEMTDPHGQAGAYAAWFRRVAEGLLTDLETDGYNPARDLTLAFVSPVYTTCDEPGQPELWEEEVAYFRLLSTLLGPQPNVLFGFREQFYRADGSRKIQQLRQALTEVGHGHGAMVIAFAGGDNYTSDDLSNVSGGFATLYQGATSVCLSNSGLHNEPIQVLNAEFLWNSQADGFAIDPGSNKALEPILARVKLGQWRPEALCGEGRTLQQICRHLWGEAVGDLMVRARLCGGETGEGPVSHVWWTITREARRLTAEYVPWNDPVDCEALAGRWARRVETTREALGYAREATRQADEEDSRYFALSLEIGLGFAEVLAQAYAWRARGDESAHAQAIACLQRVRDFLKTIPAPVATDILGGDPGCRQETVEVLARVLEPTRTP
jgi:hypothetical protein